MNIYFCGIGGVGLGPLAEIAHDAGYVVSGSDIDASLMTDTLIKRGIAVHVGPQDGEHLQASHNTAMIDWLIYTAAVPAGHPELVRARQLGIRIAKRDELIAHIISDKKLKMIAVSGTHGKTTTTGMLIWACQQLDIPISYSIGTTISFGPSGQFNPKSEYFIYECDEFDRNFLHFSPYISLIASLDYDHPDTYPSEREYHEAFRQFAGQSQQVISWRGQHGELFDDLFQVSQLAATDINPAISLSGVHNRRNATLVQTALRRLGFSQETSGILSQFPGTDRRFEKLADNLYSDYGHHPVEIEATLQLARELSDHVVLIYQPHQNIRQHEICDQYTDQFESADQVYWLPTYLSREDPALEILSPAQLTQHVTNKEHVDVADFNDELWGSIQKARESGALVLAMGAGSIDGWLRSRL